MPAGTVLLEYLVAPEGSHLWLVTENRLQHFNLPPEAVLGRSVNVLYRAMTARNQVVAGESLEARGARIEAEDRSASLAVKVLSQLLLPPQLVLGSEQKILIVPDGPLQYVPFAALFYGRQTLEEKWEIVDLPSASSVARTGTQIAPLSGKM